MTRGTARGGSGSRHRRSTIPGMAYDMDLATRIRRLVGGRPGVTEKEMFGGIAFLLGGNMFVGIVKNDLMARVGPEGHERALGRPAARPMDFAGRPMKGYVYVAPEGCTPDEALAEWVRTCAAFAATLPPKKPGEKKSMKRPVKTTPTQVSRGFAPTAAARARLGRAK